MDTAELMEIFIDEAKEHLQNLNEHLLILEKEPENENTINEIFRAAHSLKGMSGTMGFKRMQRLTHDMENIFQEIRSGKMKVRPELTDVLFTGLDALQEYLDNIIDTGSEGDNDNEELLGLIDRELKLGLGIDGSNADNSSKGSLNNSGKEAPGTGTNKDNLTEEKNVCENEGKKNNIFIKLEKYELEAIKDGAEDGLNGYLVHVDISEDSLLRGARAYLCLREMEGLGELIKSVPDTKSIEEEKMDFDFTVVMMSEAAESLIHDRVASVSEIKQVTVIKIDPDRYEEMRSEAEKNISESQNSLKSCNESNGENKSQGNGKTDAGETTGGNTNGESAGSETERKSENGKSSGNGTDGKSAARKASAGRSLRVDIEKLDELMNLVSELIIAKNGIVSIKPGDLSTKEKIASYNEQIENLERITTNMHRSVMKVRMVPIENAINKFPRMIRDLSKTLKKPMELVITGEDTELDRTVIDELGDPLQHILRNSADHGLEMPEERKKYNKPETGTIFLDACQEGNSVVIKCGDDGGGINIEKVRMKAIERGVVSEEQAALMNDNDFINLLFKPSFSTADRISDISGRGVGLDVVKTKIENLGGSVECSSERYKGTTFTIRLPLSLAIIESLMVMVGKGKYVIPLASIETIEDIKEKNISRVDGMEAVNIRDRVIPVIRMNKLLNEVYDDNSETEEISGEDVVHDDNAETERMSGKNVNVNCSKEIIGRTQEKSGNSNGTSITGDNNSLTMVIVKQGEKRGGLLVDDLCGRLDAVIKPIGKYISYPRFLTGATILGNGEIALILDVNAII